MGTLLLRLVGPLQAWGSESRFTERKTGHEPTKSGVVGLLASALGRRRTDPVDDIASFPMAVRIDCPGSYEVDFQTAHMRKFDAGRQAWVFADSLPLSRRYYLSDARFVVGVQMPDDVLASFAEALEHPVFPLYLGRRSCPPSEKILIGACEGVAMAQAVANHPWEVSEALLRRKRYSFVPREDVFACGEVPLTLIRDVLPTDGDELVRQTKRDVPLSFSPDKREYGWRTVVHDKVIVTNPFVRPQGQPAHDPFAAL